jgi:uncharacterized damage-inducible protein DinB
MPPGRHSTLPSRFPSVVIPLLAESIQPSSGRGWHGGPTPLGAIRGVTLELASWTPAPGRKSIWALTLHIAYWDYAVRRQLEGGPRGAFPRSPANWPRPPRPGDEREWAADVDLLRSEHRLLLAAVNRLDPRLLGRRPPTARQWTYGELVTGIAAHDAYHTGQIQLMKRLWREMRAGKARG